VGQGAWSGEGKPVDRNERLIVEVGSLQSAVGSGTRLYLKSKNLAKAIIIFNTKSLDRQITR